MNSLRPIALAGLLVLFGGCAAKRTSAELPTRDQLSPAMYAERPRTLLVLPPMNATTDAEAKGHYMTTIEAPLAQMGYYVFPIELVSEIMKQEGVYDTELLYKLPLQKFRDYFDTDAVMFTRITKWDVAYGVVASTLRVTIAAEIRSTRTGRLLWHDQGTITADLSGGVSSSSLTGLLVNIVSTAVQTAAADYVEYAHKVNRRMLYTLPAGPYHELYGADQDLHVRTLP